MQHQHFDKIPSTQIYLREHLQEFSDPMVLISCDQQTQGIGRTGNVWDFYPQSLAMSFLIVPHSVASLTSIEIGILTVLFLKQKFSYSLLLKWPNDLMTMDLKKCGGIISHYINNQQVIAGLGINFSSPTNQYPYQTSHVSLDQSFSPKNLSLEIYEFILANRIHSAEKVIEQFNLNCAHLNQDVTINDDSNSSSGIFKGISGNGEALIAINGIEKKFLAGTLYLQ
jgi:biotin-[acetyl-CoA-carboxylase] ligase BirA-like protein